MERAPGVLAVHSLDHFALTVPDVAEAKQFYELFGLRTSEHSSVLEVSARNGLAAQIFENGVRRLHHLTFGIFADDAPGFSKHLERERVQRVNPPSALAKSSSWFRDPDENVLELAVLERRAPHDKVRMQVEISPGGVAGAPSFDHRVTPARIGHCLIFSPDVDRQIDFYTRVLGLRLADRSASNIAFLYSPHGSDHHVLAIARSDRPGFHHASFEVANVDEIGIGAIRMAERGFSKGWGFGRHFLGSNYFHYVRDPWGGFAEYFCDIDYIPAGCDWEVRNVDPRFSLHLWGPDVPPYFLMNFEGCDSAELD